MQAYRVETIITEDKVLTLRSLPFEVGEQVEVIVLAKTPQPDTTKQYPLRGLPVTYIDPFTPVAQGDWDAAR